MSIGISPYPMQKFGQKPGQPSQTGQPPQAGQPQPPEKSAGAAAEHRAA